MLFKLFRRAPALRLFSEVKVVSSLVTGDAGAVTDATPWSLDFGSVPVYSSGNYDEKMSQIFTNYVSSLRSIAGGKANRIFFDSILVYSFMEHVPLSNAAQIEQLSETKFKVTAFDPTNAPTIETALKKSPYNLKVVRDMDVIDVTMTLDKEGSKAAAAKFLADAKVKIEDVVKEAAVRFGEKNKYATESIATLSKRVIADMEQFHQKKVTEVGN
ncbi:hypothetical protein SteCoe_37925 [Stentor coeruleus]|uniref:Ribosome recycling factor domain-containing protein n=1 Tax=Stentor coeruleus TaxID=5963 RepID=A0A1R2AM43_9CILI|nr:hypothetical protein SteCoe_37925 [Stentor coeruleus]